MIIDKYIKERKENKNKELILLGTAASVIDVDYEKDNCDYWACGSVFCESHKDVKKVTLGFEIHKMDLIKKIHKQKGYNYNKFKCPVFVQEKNQIAKEYIKNPVIFPLDDVKQYVKEIGASINFTSTFCYMLVYSAMLGYKNISLNKILLSGDDEYALERPGVEYWIETLRVNENIKYTIPEDSEILSDRLLYGYEELPNLWKIKSQTKTIWESFEKHYLHVTNLSIAMAEANGMLMMYDFLSKNLEKEKIDIMLKECKEILKNTDNLKSSNNTLTQLIGILQYMSLSELRGY